MKTEINTEMTYKICLAGDGGVGKTTYLNMLLTDVFEKRYVATWGVEVRPLIFHTNYGTLTFDVWDMAGQEKFEGLGDAYMAPADGAMLMCSGQSRMSVKNIPKWRRMFRRIHEKKGNIVLICNKSELAPEFENESVVKISVRNRENLHEPFIKMARLLTGKEDLFFN